MLDRIVDVHARRLIWRELSTGYAQLLRLAEFFDEAVVELVCQHAHESAENTDAETLRVFRTGTDNEREAFRSALKKDLDKAYGEGVVTRSVDNFQGSA